MIFYSSLKIRSYASVRDLRTGSPEEDRTLMFPIGDDNSARRTMPVVTYALIVLHIMVFLIELNGGAAFIKQWASVPSRFISNPASEVPTIFTAMFMHGGWLHLFG